MAAGTRYTTIRDAIAEQVKTVAAVGRVYNHARSLSDWAAFIAQFVLTLLGRQETRGWWVWLEESEDTEFTFANIQRRHLFVVSGIQALRDSDDTDSAMGDLTYQVMDALRTLAVSGVWYVQRPHLRRHDERFFGSTLCHYSEIAIPLLEEIA